MAIYGYLMRSGNCILVKSTKSFPIKGMYIAQNRQKWLVNWRKNKIIEPPTMTLSDRPVHRNWVFPCLMKFCERFLSNNWNVLCSRVFRIRQAIAAWFANFLFFLTVFNFIFFAWFFFSFILLTRWWMRVLY